MTSEVVPLKVRLARIAPFFRGSSWGFVLAAVGTIVAASTEPMVPALLRLLLDRGFSAGKLSLWLVPVAVIGLFAVRGLAGFLAQYGLSWSANRGIQKLRQSLFARLLESEPALFTRNSASSLINTVTYEVQTGTTLLVNAVLALVRDSLTLVALLIYLLYLNWQLTLFVAVLFPLVAFVMRVVSRRLHRLTIQTQNATDQLAYVVEENVLAWRIVRLHEAAPAQKGRFGEVSEALRRLSLKSTVAASTTTPLTQVLAACALSAVIVIALWQSRSGGSTVGDFVGFVTAMLMLVTPIKHLSEIAGPITRGLAALDRGINMLEHTPPEIGGGFNPGRAQGRIELRDVSLRYRDDQPAALDGVSLDIGVGETVALVGPSGSGKSTLVNLLPRFLEPVSGTVLLDGVTLAEWDIHALRRQFALVSQDVVLFNDTVAANVCLGADMDRDRVLAALASANLREFVEKLPQGIDTPVGHNGSQLSGGQRQRLAIARAVYKDAPILILDEATSALDSESERLVQTALERLMAGRTSLVIAHRLSTIEAADRVVVLEQGRVLEQGTHGELLARGGLFARLHALQFNT
jgi:ATP-binding cassette, subfamily B, bacterial MsbA